MQYWSLIIVTLRSPDNARFASSGGDRSVFLWEVATGNTIRRISGHMGRVNVVEFNEDASVVASGWSSGYHEQLGSSCCILT